MRVILSCLLWVILSTQHAAAEPVAERYERQAKEAQALVLKAVNRYHQINEAAFAQISRQGEFTTENLYVYVVNVRGIMLASGGPSSILIGRDITPLLDDALKQAFAEVRAQPETDALQNREYRWINWQDGKVERKHAYYKRVGDLIFAAGYYLPRATQAQAQQLLSDATESLRSNVQDTLSRINQLDPYFNRDDLYVFVVDLDSEKFVAHGFQRRLIGTDFRSLRSSAGEAVGQSVLAAIKGHDQASVGYTWTNPTTGAREHKQTLLQRSGHYLLAVGYYEPR